MTVQTVGVFNRFTCLPLILILIELQPQITFVECTVSENVMLVTKYLIVVNRTSV